MIRFKVFFKNGKIKTLDAKSRDLLLKNFFDNDEEKLKKEVSKIEWADRKIQVSENVETGELERSIIGADTNPFGWRNEAMKDEDER